MPETRPSRLEVDVCTVYWARCPECDWNAYFPKEWLATRAANDHNDWHEAKHAKGSSPEDRLDICNCSAGVKSAEMHSPRCPVGKGR